MGGGVGGSLDFLAALRLFKEGIRSVSPVDVGPPEGFESWILGVEVGDKHTSSIFCGRFVTLQLPVNNYSRDYSSSGRPADSDRQAK